MGVCLGLQRQAQMAAARPPTHASSPRSPVGIMTLYTHLLATSKAPAVARGYSEFDTVISGVLARVGMAPPPPTTMLQLAPHAPPTASMKAESRLSKLQTMFPREAAQMKIDAQRAEAAEAGGRR